MSSPSVPERRVALVTGASRGIGKACAKALARDGLAVALHFRSQTQKAEETAQEITREGGRAQAFAADLAQPGEAARLAEAVAAAMGGPAVLVHAAGEINEKPLAFLKPGEWQALLELHALSAHALAQAVLRHARKSEHGRLVFFGSLAGVLGLGNAAGYAATKGALTGLAKSLALECARWKTTVNVVAPGYVETDMTAGQDEAKRRTTLADIPLGRYGTAEEIAALVAFLCSPNAAYLTGQVLALDGGLGLG